jgi:hypothetical protein
MLRWKPTHQFSKSLRDFLVKIPDVVFGVPGGPTPAPRVPLVLRLGAAGPLQFRAEDEKMSLAVTAILTALKHYADMTNPEYHRRLFSDATAPPPALLRFVGQLAAGFDQMVASAALGIGYGLHVVLPGSRAAFVQDIRRNLPDNALADAAVAIAPAVPGGMPQTSDAARDRGSAAALARFASLIGTAERILELDRDNEASDDAPFRCIDYAQAGLVILDHCDLGKPTGRDNRRPGSALYCHRSSARGNPKPRRICANRRSVRRDLGGHERCSKPTRPPSR